MASDSERDESGDTTEYGYHRLYWYYRSACLRGGYDVWNYKSYKALVQAWNRGTTAKRLIEPRKFMAGGVRETDAESLRRVELLQRDGDALSRFSCVWHRRKYML